MNNIQVNHQIKYKFFDRSDSENQQLLVYVGYDELSFAIIAEPDNTIVYLKSYRLKDADNYFAYKMWLTDILEQEELFKQKYAQISIGLNAANYTLVPNKYFDLSSAERYFDFNYHYDGSGKIMANLVDGFNCFVVYAIDFQLLETFTEIFDQFTLQHAISYLLPALPTTNDQKNLYVHVQKNHLDIVCFDGQKLLFCNSFSYSTSADFLYHILNTGKQTGLNPDTDNYILLGDVVRDQEQYQLCRKYIPKITFGSRPAGKNFCPELDIISLHHHFNLYCIG